MKCIFIFLILFLTGSAQAISLEVYGSKGQKLFQYQEGIQLPASVGAISVGVFEKEGVPFEGGVEGIEKIYDLRSDIDVLSDNEMKAYGWCFSVNGLVPDTMPDQTPVVDPSAKIVWFYGYAHYRDGQWLGQCLHDFRFPATP